MCTTRIYIQAGREGERLECEDFRACRLEDGGGVCACGLWEGCECRVGVGGGRLGVEGLESQGGGDAEQICLPEFDACRVAV